MNYCLKLKKTRNTSPYSFRDKVLYRLLRPFGAAFSDPKFPAALLLRQVIIQKFLRINAHVPWPVHWTTKVKCPEKIQRGTRCPGLSVGCYIDGRNGIIIGKNVWIGPHVSLVSMNHDLNDYQNFILTDPIIIGDNCWLATGVIILPGVKLGNHVVGAAGSVINKSFRENNIIVAGVPAKIVKKLGDYKESDGINE
jgi:acetyltransferase-like isoleucine patch superfamily enzyme